MTGYRVRHNTPVWLNTALALDDRAIQSLIYIICV